MPQLLTSFPHIKMSGGGIGDIDVAEVGLAVAVDQSGSSGVWSPIALG